MPFPKNVFPKVGVYKINGAFNFHVATGHIFYPELERMEYFTGIFKGNVDLFMYSNRANSLLA